MRKKILTGFIVFIAQLVWASDQNMDGHKCLQNPPPKEEHLFLKDRFTAQVNPGVNFCRCTQQAWEYLRKQCDKTIAEYNKNYSGTIDVPANYASLGYSGLGCQAFCYAKDKSGKIVINSYGKAIRFHILSDYKVVPETEGSGEAYSKNKDKIKIVTVSSKNQEEDDDLNQKDNTLQLYNYANPDECEELFPDLENERKILAGVYNNKSLHLCWAYGLSDHLYEKEGVVFSPIHLASIMNQASPACQQKECNPDSLCASIRLDQSMDKTCLTNFGNRANICSQFNKINPDKPICLNRKNEQYKTNDRDRVIKALEAINSYKRSALDICNDPNGDLSEDLEEHSKSLKICLEKIHIDFNSDMFHKVALCSLADPSHVTSLTRIMDQSCKNKLRLSDIKGNQSDNYRCNNINFDKNEDIAKQQRIAAIDRALIIGKPPFISYNYCKAIRNMKGNIPCELGPHAATIRKKLYMTDKNGIKKAYYAVGNNFGKEACPLLYNNAPCDEKTGDLLVEADVLVSDDVFINMMDLGVRAPTAKTDDSKSWPPQGTYFDKECNQLRSKDYQKRRDELLLELRGGSNRSRGDIIGELRRIGKMETEIIRHINFNSEIGRKDDKDVSGVPVGSSEVYANP